jgi:hypothetical protein
MDKDIVVFRKWKDGFGVIALFPEIPTDLYGRYCESYEHVGQHGGADYQGVIMNTRPANVEESADLAEELQIIGYDLRAIKKASQQHHERRRRLARHLAMADTE